VSVPVVPEAEVNQIPSVSSVASEELGVAKIKEPAAVSNEKPMASSPLMLSVPWRLRMSPAMIPGKEGPGSESSAGSIVMNASTASCQR